MNKQKGNIEVVVLILIAVTLIAASIGGAYWASSITCKQQTESFDDSKYGFFSGCMVVHQGRWLPLNNIRGFD